MADIEPKEVFRQIGIDLINEYRVRGGFKPIDWLAVNTPEASAFIRSIQLHEKTKQELQDVNQELHDFKQEVSDIVYAYVHADGGPDDWEKLETLIISKPKPDPLVEVAKSFGYFNTAAKAWADELRVAVEAIGFEIREKGQ